MTEVLSTQDDLLSTYTGLSTSSELDIEPAIAYDSQSHDLESGSYGERLVVNVVDQLARKQPDRVWATVSRSPFHLGDGFRDITMRELAQAVDAAAWIIDNKYGKSKTFDVIAYIGVSDVRYAIFMFAAIKTGHQIMIPSVRNSVSQHDSVFKAANCTRVIHTPEMSSVITAMKSSKRQLDAILAPTLDELLESAGTSPYAYDRTWAEGRTDPIIIAHSSGSTGNPKPTTITNGVYSVYDNHRKIPPIPGRKIQGYLLLELNGGRFFNPFPPFHLAGLFAMTIMPIFYTCTVTLGPKEKPPSGEILSQAMHLLPSIRAAWCPPTVIEQLVSLPGGFEQAANLDWIMYTGGPLAPTVGDRLCKVTDVCQMYGSTETGPHVALVPLPENWNYFEWHPHLENEMDPMGDGTFEMVVRKDPSLDWIRHLAQAYPHLDVWRTNDLFVQAPHNPKLWRFVGRRDDVIVLSNGEKFNPVNMEGVISGHPLVKGALVTGTARFQAALVMEPVEGLAMTSSEFIEKVWDTVENANMVGPAHGRIFRSKITMATPEKPFIRAGKGTVIRGRTTKLYAAELDALYDDNRNCSLPAGDPALQKSSSLEDTTKFIRECIVKLMSPISIGDNDDFFVLGMDSLQTLELLNMVKRSMEPSTKLTVADIYASPSIKQLAQHLHEALGGLETTTTPRVEDRISTMNRIIDKYTADFKRSDIPSGPPRCVVITGSTGSLGTHLLETLLSNEHISKIYCLNRDPQASERQKRGFIERGKATAKMDAKAIFLTIKLGERNLGLNSADFEDIRRNADVIIHNAWKLDFNHKVESFDSVHLRGTHDFIDLALSSQRQPHLLFVSSLSAVGNWAAIHGAAIPVPEIVPRHCNVAMPIGYGESKHVAERMISAAVTEAGLHGSILRVGQIAGPLAADGGEWHRTEWFPSLLQTSKAMGCLPDSMGTIDWIPVDVLSDIIGDIVLGEYARVVTYNYNLNWDNYNPNWMANMGDLNDADKHQVEMIEQAEPSQDDRNFTSSSDNEHESEVPPGYWTSYRFIGTVMAIVLLANNLFIGYAMPANILNVINADIGPDSLIYLATLMNTLIKGVGLLLVGSLSDVLGRRYFMVAGQACGFIGSVIAARADDITTLIGANVLLGMAGATQVLYPLLSQEIVPNKYRGFSQSAITLSVFPTIGLGPAFARMMVEYTAQGWRWCFWLNAITTGISLVLFLVCYFPPNFEQLTTGVSKIDQLRRIDYGGLVFYSGGLLCVLLALSWGGRQYAWDSAHVLSTLIIGFVLLVVFVLYEVYWPLASPLLPMNLFKIRNFVVAVIVGSVGQMPFYALNVLWPTQITNLYTTDNISIGWMSCTTGAALAAGEVMFGPLCKRSGRLKLQMIVSVLGLVIFCGLMALGNENRQGLAIAMTVLVGIFVGWIELICIVLAGLVIPPENIGSGSAFFASARAVSGTIATSIYLAIYSNRSSSLLPGKVRVAAVAAGLSADRIEEVLQALASGKPAGIDAIRGMTPAIKTAVQAAQKAVYATSFSTVYLSSLSFGIVALGVCFLLTDDVDRHFTAFLNKTVTPRLPDGDEKVDRGE
ncbi:hypothetical protein CkaCkLH20_11893 [Colletotrichum karsti]|uniref:Carrier domain-containing protein n=1 Tax=Colletotrichum karsti TaxID=1095194 RepID=A0A9P6LFP8_9PEZI|nr:uncharacterized protein CkaCkLH20_11893 [Colletotrichum karsti]KAF9870587.1 hypothetical protein CkaCkLH20_11893 [Colletotrichum karsti]